MTTLIDYALLAGASYFDTRADLNRFPLPQSWIYISRKPSVSSGFEAAAFRNGNDIVISYAGTYPGDISGDIMADIWLGTGIGSLQLFQAAQYYLAIKNDPQYQGCNITLTGHSLGGGLAALVGVFFGVSATTFDQAPFKNSAQDPSLVTSGNPLNLIAPNVAANLRTDLLTSGYTLSTSLSPAWQNKLATLEQFNGRSFYRMPWEGRTNAVFAQQGIVIGWQGNPKSILVGLTPAQTPLLNQAYDALKECVYQDLLSQTRLKPYFEGVDFVIRDGRYVYEFGRAQALFEQQFRVNPEKAGAANDAFCGIAERRFA